MDFMQWLLTAQIPVAGSALLLREVLGNAFGLASALGGMARRVWAWPVGIAGNLLLLTVFAGTAFAGAAFGVAPAGGVGSATLWGQVGRQVMFLAVSAYGWAQWHRSRSAARRADGTGRSHTGHDSAAGDGAVAPRWAGGRARFGLVLAMVAGTAALTPVFSSLGSYPPVWADAWTFMGSLLATYGMARGWTEFWLIWVAVDVVGVPLLFSAGYYASATMYAFYGAFTLAGFFVWWRAQRREARRAAAVASAPLSAENTAVIA
ncbi:nicotinamide mononucleotide transporter family protein [Sinomonas sp. ASV322]|uniref:nicotinamide mononucleotide transporter family protein n=1 Tax=Sinomonas sp. ASV322 TaxID=3041920 RepID=UPI0027DC5699|nr:nicotinamide mononucleotide transporter family protein [Sinomonas sp. ASV322]MDQ4500912.1 nicotinamide mononucleotide transporter family protein [Sinomonas sp. ASV322]